MRRGALGAIATLAVIGAGWGGWTLVQGDALRVQRVTVVGAGVEGPRTIAAAADLDGRSLLRLDLDAAARRVRALPGVAEATVERDWPNGARIAVVEHIGWGYWQAAGERVVIDATGLVPPRARPPHDGAPTVVEIAAARAPGPGERVDADTVALLERMYREGVFDRLQVQPTGFEFRRDRGLTIRVAAGPAAVFGDSQSYEFKVAAWGSLLERMEGQALDAREIDLRFGQQLVLR